jgi:hypothetical protein
MLVEFFDSCLSNKTTHLSWHRVNREGPRYPAFFDRRSRAADLGSILLDVLARWRPEFFARVVTPNSKPRRGYVAATGRNAVRRWREDKPNSRTRNRSSRKTSGAERIDRSRAPIVSPRPVHHRTCHMGLIDKGASVCSGWPASFVRVLELRF